MNANNICILITISCLAISLVIVLSLLFDRGTWNSKKHNKTHQYDYVTAKEMCDIIKQKKDDERKAARDVVDIYWPTIIGHINARLVKDSDVEIDDGNILAFFPNVAKKKVLYSITITKLYERVVEYYKDSDCVVTKIFDNAYDFSIHYRPYRNEKS